MFSFPRLMTFLPVAQRELRAAARRKGTFHLRMTCAGIAAGIALLMLVGISITGAGQQAGLIVFQTLLFGGHLFAILVGTILTSDSIAEERREGTLGFLFLTDLGGLDVIAGKFAGTIVNAVFSLAAIFPVMAIAWFSGGVGNGEFWRNGLVLLNHLFFASAAGIVVSAGESRPSRAITLTAAVLLAGGVGVDLLGWGLAKLTGSQVWNSLAAISPLHARRFADTVTYGTNPLRFWATLAASHAAAWGMITAAVFRLNRRWRTAEKEAPVRRRPVRRSLLDAEPIRALLAGPRWPALLAWGLAAPMVVPLLVSVVLLLQSPGAIAGAGPFVAFAGHVYALVASSLILLVAAWEASSFLSEARRSGALELILTTAVSEHAFTGAAQSHLSRRYLGPILVVLVAGLVSNLLSPASSVLLSIPLVIGATLRLIALPNIALWFSLTEPRPMLAFGKVAAFGIVIPAVLDGICCLGWLLPPILMVWTGSKLRLPLRDIVNGIRSHWQRRDGWMHATPNASPSQQPPRLPMSREP